MSSEDLHLDTQVMQQLMDERDAAVDIILQITTASDTDEREYALAEAKQFIQNLNKRS